MKFKYQIFLLSFSLLAFLGEAQAFDYRYDIFDNFSKSSFATNFGATIIFALILLAAFFGSSSTKFIVWGWISFFAVFAIMLGMFVPIDGILELFISLGVAFLVLMFFIHLSSRAEDKENSEMLRRMQFFQKQSKKRKKKKKK